MRSIFIHPDIDTDVDLYSKLNPGSNSSSSNPRYDKYIAELQRKYALKQKKKRLR